MPDDARKFADVTELSNNPPAKPRRRGLVRRLRQLITNSEANQRSIQASQVLQQLITNSEANQRSIQASQVLQIQYLKAHAAAPFTSPLISPQEFATGDRYELENRCRAMTNPVYVGENTALCRILGSYKFFVDTRDTTFGCHVVLDGYWETWVTVFVARQLQPGMTVIDVGANYGYYTLLFGALVGETGHVYAIEPNPTVLPKLDLSLKLNGLATRTTVVRAAAGASTMAEVLLYAPHGEPGGSMIIASTESARAEMGTVYTVPQVMIDDVVHDAARIALVKIDAEGAEESVIEGMSGTLARDKPCLLLEFNVARYRDPRGFVSLLQSLYSRMRFIDFDGNAVPASIEDLLDVRRVDWMLYFDQAE